MNTTLCTSIARDLRYSIRLLRRHRAFNAAMVVTVAIVIAASTCVFAPLYTIVFHKIALPAANRLVMLWESDRDTGLEHTPVTEGAYPVYRHTLKSFDGLAAFVPHSPLLPPVTVFDTGERVVEVNATPEFFTMLAGRAFLGRMFTAPESEPSGPQAAILSYRWWKSHFGGRTDVVGRSLSVNYFGSREVYRIVGVMPAGFEFPRPLFAERPDVWLSLPYDHEHFSPGSNFFVIGRLKNGVSLARAQAELDTVAAGLSVAQPRFYGARSIRAVPLNLELVRGAKAILLALVSALVFVILIGGANIANLIIVRGVWSEREATIRMAIGAARSDIFRQITMEVAVLTTLGGSLGLVLGVWGVTALPLWLPSSIYFPRVDALALNGPVLLFAFLLCLTTSVGFGAVASARLTVGQTRRALHGPKSAPSSNFGRLLRRPASAVLILEVALAVALVCGAFVMFRGLRSLLGDEAAFKPANLLAMDVFFSNNAPEGSKPVIAEYQNFLFDAQSIAGIQDVALAEQFPLGHESAILKVTPGAPAGLSARVAAEVHIITPEYLKMMKLDAINGRPIRNSDGPDSNPVAVVNEAFARRYSSVMLGLGSRLGMERRPSKEWPPAFQIVGIVREPPRFGAGDTAPPAVYIPFTQAPMRNLAVIIRTDMNPRRVAGIVRDRVLQIAPGKVTVNRIQTGTDIVADFTARSRFISAQLGAFALLALALASAGIYGLVSFYTSRRTREIGVRMAVGSTRVGVVVLVVRQGLTLVGVGIALGIGLALVLVRVLTHLGYYARPVEFGTYLAVGVLFCVIGSVASYLPARRAASIEPVEVLRAE